MSEPFDAGQYLEAAARALELPVTPQWRGSVVANLATTAELARLVMAFPVDDREEPAPVFEA